MLEKLERYPPMFGPTPFEEQELVNALLSEFLEA